jgi:2-aminoethylphosphonate transport system permease protein
MPVSDAAVIGAAPSKKAEPGRLWIVPPAALLSLLFLYPLALIARQAFLDDSGMANAAEVIRVLNSRFFFNALVNTIQISVAATAGCLIVGLVLALILAFVPFPGSGFVARLIDTFIALPTFLVTLAFTFIYGSAGILNGALMEAFSLPLPPVDFVYSAWGVILAEITVYTPFILRPLLAAFSLVDRGQIEAASVLGARPFRIIRQVILPAAVPALIAGGSLCLLLTLNEFGIVLFIGAKGVITLPMVIYGKAIQEFDYTAGCVVAVVNIALSVALYSLYRFALARTGGGRAVFV